MRRKAASSKARDRTHLVAIAVAIEVLEPKGFGRIRLRRIQAPSIDALIPFVRENVELGATVRTDGSPIYRPLRKVKGSITIRSSSWVRRPRPTDHLPGVHRIASLLKRWLLGTHHGAVDPRHVDYYLDEFTFRFNRRTSRSRGMLFYRLIQQSTIATPVTYADIRDNQHRPQALRSLTGHVELNG